MSEHVIRQNKDRVDPLREPKVNEILLYTISSRQDYKDEDGNFRITSMDLDKARVHPYIHAIQTPNRFMVKVGQNGRLFNPYGLYSEGMETKQRVGRPTWKFVTTNENNFKNYVKFLTTKNEIFLKNAEREII
jgi:hypothetical protein